jgi:DNA polymerase-3 subunit delta'
VFVGPDGVGKRLVAKGIAQCLFCQRVSDEQLDACGACAACRQVLADTHPDLLTVGCPEGKRELPIALIAGEGERRGREGLLHDLSLRPMSATRRIAIIDDADTMNEESANALLKTLEEPPPGSLLFLISPSLDALLCCRRFARGASRFISVRCRNRMSPICWYNWGGRRTHKPRPPWRR